MKRAIVYARYSDEKQTEQSIEGQLRVCEGYAKLHGYSILEKYIDRAMSGKIADRPAFLKMIEDSKSGAFSAVIVYQLDRFARNSYDSALYEYKLNKNNVVLLSAKENISDDPSGKLLKQVLIGLNEYYVAELAVKVNRGMSLTAEKKKHNGGPVPFGYKLDNEKKYIPDPLKAAYVKMIFEKYAQGDTIKKIINWLNHEKITTANGRPFGRASIDWLLHNERYLGTYIWKNHKYENAFEALVSKTLFEQVQNMKQLNKNARARGRKTNFRLTTKATCGVCGANVIGDTGTSSTGRTYHYYICYNSSTKRKNTVCKSKRLSKDKLEELIYNKTLELVNENGFLEYAAKEATRVYNAEKNSNTIGILQNELKDCARKRSNLLKALEEGVSVTEIKNRITDYDAKIESLELQIAQESLIDNKLDFDENAFKYFISMLIDKDSENKEQHMTNIFNRLIREVVFYDSYIEVRYNYADEIIKERPKTVALERSSFAELVIHPRLERGTP